MLVQLLWLENSCSEAIEAGRVEAERPCHFLCVHSDRATRPPPGSNNLLLSWSFKSVVAISTLESRSLRLFGCVENLSERIYASYAELSFELDRFFQWFSLYIVVRDQLCVPSDSPKLVLVPDVFWIWFPITNRIYCPLLQVLASDRRFRGVVGVELRAGSHLRRSVTMSTPMSVDFEEEVTSASGSMPTPMMVDSGTMFCPPLPLLVLFTIHKSCFQSFHVLGLNSCLEY